MIMTMTTKIFDNYNGDNNNYDDNDSEKYDNGDNEYENDNDIENNNNSNNNTTWTEKCRLCVKAQESVTYVLPGCSAM